MDRIMATGCGVAAALILLATGVTSGAGGLGPQCPGDANGDLAVDFDDLNAVLEHWGTTASAGDVNGDGDVDFDDLYDVLFWWDDCAFDYGPDFEDLEAWQIGLEMLGSIGPLNLPPATYARIDRDLDLIRAFEPTLASQTHTPAWSPSALIIGLIDGADRSAFDAYNAYFGVTGESELFSFGGITYVVITFPDRLNVVRLASMYADLAPVNSAEPDALLGGQNYYTPTLLISGNWRWDIDDGFWDCFDGCDCHYIWAFETDNVGIVTLIDAFQFGQPWCPWPR